MSSKKEIIKSLYYLKQFHKMFQYNKLVALPWIRVDIYSFKFYVALNYIREHGLKANKKWKKVLNQDTFLRSSAVSCLKSFYFHISLPQKRNWD